MDRIDQSFTVPSCDADARKLKSLAAATRVTAPECSLNSATSKFFCGRQPIRFAPKFDVPITLYVAAEYYVELELTEGDGDGMFDRALAELEGTIPRGPLNMSIGLPNLCVVVVSKPFPELKSEPMVEE